MQSDSQFRRPNDDQIPIQKPKSTQKLQLNDLQPQLALGDQQSSILQKSSSPLNQNHRPRTSKKIQQLDRNQQYGQLMTQYISQGMQGGMQGQGSALNQQMVAPSHDDFIVPNSQDNSQYHKAIPGTFVDSMEVDDEDVLRQMLRQSTPIRFDWENKWLRGDQYAHMLHNIENYSQIFGMQMLGEKQHPENIYIQPENGQVYFVRANSIGSDFGFPRLGIKKRYKWKKMNFTTDLPKRNPLVSYIVASAVRCEKFFPPGSKGSPVYRMHAVILKLKPGQQTGMTPLNPFTLQKNEKNCPLYICCHVRRVEASEGDSSENASETPKQLAQKGASRQLASVSQRANQLNNRALQQQSNSQQTIAEKKAIKVQNNIQNSDSKRPRRVVNQRALIDEDRDPYIYTGYINKQGVTLGRRARKDMVAEQALPNAQKRQDEQSPASHGNHQKLERNLPSNLFPMKNFGATLFESIAADNQRTMARRRAMTDVDDLIGNDIDSVGNKSKPAAVERAASPKHRSGDPSNLEIIDLDKIKEKRRRDAKYESKEDLLQKLPFGSGIQRKTSLDLDAMEKIKTSDLRNILRKKYEGYLSRPEVDPGNSGARRVALGILPPPTSISIQQPNKGFKEPNQKQKPSPPKTDKQHLEETDVQNVKTKKVQVVDVDERGRCDSLAGMYRVNNNNMGGFNDKSQGFVSPAASPAMLAQPFFGGAQMGNYQRGGQASLQNMLMQSLAPAGSNKPVGAPVMPASAQQINSGRTPPFQPTPMPTQQYQIDQFSYMKHLQQYGGTFQQFQGARAGSFLQNRGISMCSDREDFGPQNQMNQFQHPGHMSGMAANQDFYNQLFIQGGSGQSRNHRMSMDYSGFLNKNPPSDQK